MNSLSKSTVRSVAFLGMDGIGKSTIAKELKKKFDRGGRRSEIVSVTKLHKQNDGSALTHLMSGVSDLSLRSLFTFTDHDFGKSMGVDTLSLEIPGDTADPPKNEENALLAAALVEFGGGMLLHCGVERTMVDKGIVPIYESWAFKHGVKALMLARYLREVKGTSSSDRPEEELLSSMTNAFERLRPSLGIYVTGDPELALKWRLADGADFGPLEDCRIIGAPGAEGFLRLQTETDTIFRHAAEAWGWITITMLDQPVHDNIAMAMEAIEDAIA